MRISAWLLSQDCAMKTASSPNRTAKPIMTMVLMRTTDNPLSARESFACHREPYRRVGGIELVKSCSGSGAMLKIA